jgi:hypothetical protein
LAHRVLSEIPRKRIARQIEPDGSQPLELARADSWRYSVFNLEALCDTASLGGHLGIDLWKFETADNPNALQRFSNALLYATGTTAMELPSTTSGAVYR